MFIEFAQRYPSALGRKYHVISTPSLPLPSYLEGIISPNYQWLTHLTLLNVTIPRTSLIQVASVTNLVALAVGPNVLAPDIGVDDSLIRTWSRSASMGAFHSLRVLVLREQIHVSARVFEYLMSFPALAIFATNSVRGSGLSHKNNALSFGWKHRKDKSTEEGRNLGRRKDRSGWDELLQELIKLSGTVDAETLSNRNVRVLDMVPVIHLAVGGYSDNANLARSEGGPRHIWNRVSNVGGTRSVIEENLKLLTCSNSDQGPKSQSLSGPSKPDIGRKRAHDPTENYVAKKALKPILRTSKAHNIGDLLSEFFP